MLERIAPTDQEAMLDRYSVSDSDWFRRRAVARLVSHTAADTALSAAAERRKTHQQRCKWGAVRQHVSRSNSLMNSLSLFAVTESLLVLVLIVQFWICLINTYTIHKYHVSIKLSSILSHRIKRGRTRIRHWFLCSFPSNKLCVVVVHAVCKSTFCAIQITSTFIISNISSTYNVAESVLFRTIFIISYLYCTSRPLNQMQNAFVVVI